MEPCSCKGDPVRAVVSTLGRMKASPVVGSPKPSYILSARALELVEKFSSDFGVVVRVPTKSETQMEVQVSRSGLGEQRSGCLVEARSSIGVAANLEPIAVSSNQTRK
mmetsp:Transcript_6620/g.13405  ORF Transcript_6620/g.13405 Transcript_6620/m.13405 type:complete len:108 (+) Transcript_6620:1675-1998(+)